MKKFLIPEKGSFYKVNLHCHTTVSDAKLSPEQIKEAYKSHGYSAVAFTDHDVFLSHNDLTDKDFVALNGYEVEINESNTRTFDFVKCCHLCFIAKEPTTTRQVCLHRNAYMFANAPKHFNEMDFGDAPDYVREYTHERINDMIAKAKEGGFFVSYNHPTWSLEDYTNYSGYEGMDALEIYNGSCIVAGYDDNNGHCYDDMLRLGKRIACTGSDDNHNVKDFDDPRCDSFVAFTMVKAEKLDYRSLTKALENGDYYASKGPVINSVWCEDGKIHVECEGAHSIAFVTGVRRTGCHIAKEGEKLTSAEFAYKDTDKYVRITVSDERGMTASTRAYFTDELA